MEKQKKIKVAVTGSIGSGKSTFCRLLEEKGYTVVNVDELSKALLITDKSIREKIIKAFGEKSYVGKNPDKKYLAEKVFSNPASVLKINSIVHPAVKKELTTQMEKLFSSRKIVFAEAALIYEADMEQMFDYIVLITAGDQVRMKRKMAADNYSEQQFKLRNLNQIPDEEKKKRADFIFENNGSVKDLEQRVDLTVKILEGLLNSND